MKLIIGFQSYHARESGHTYKARTMDSCFRSNDKKGCNKIWLILASIVAVTFFFLPLYAEEVIILKDGKTIEGEVIGGTDSGVKIKSGNETLTFNRVDIKTLKRKEPREELLLPAVKLYEKMAGGIDKTDAEAHYKWGIFCLERNLPNDAVSEFKKAKELDNKYVEKAGNRLKAISEAKASGKYEAAQFYYYKDDYKRVLSILEKALKFYPESSLSKKIQELSELCSQKVASPEIGIDEKLIEQKLKNGEVVIPRDLEMMRIMSEYLRSLLLTKNDKDKLRMLSSEYTKMAESYFKNAESEPGQERWESYQLAVYCYELSAWNPESNIGLKMGMSVGLKISKIVGDIKLKINKNLQEKLLIPYIIEDLKWAEAFIEETERGSEDRRIALSWYYDNAKDYESRGKKEEMRNRKKELFNTASYCYLVLANSSLFEDESEIGKVGIYGWARCFEELEKLKN